MTEKMIKNVQPLTSRNAFIYCIILYCSTVLFKIDDVTIIDELMIVTFQSTSILDPIIHTQSILCDRKGMELLPIYHHRCVSMTI
jgi:hypothetical protein